MINLITFDSKKEIFVEPIAKYFAKIDEETMNQNVDRYVDYCKKNKKIKAKDSLSNELSENDEALRNELMVFRLNYSMEKHIVEKTIFTDKMIDRIVIEKPVTEIGLKKILSANTVYFCGKKILDIILKYI